MERAARIAAHLLPPSDGLQVSHKVNHAGADPPRGPYKWDAWIRCMHLPHCHLAHSILHLPVNTCVQASTVQLQLTSAPGLPKVALLGECTVLFYIVSHCLTLSVAPHVHSKKCASVTKIAHSMQVLLEESDSLWLCCSKCTF